MATTSRPIDIRALVQNFVTNLAAAVEQTTTQRIQAALMNGVNGVPLKRGPGRPPKNPLFVGAPALTAARAPGKKRPKQLCPVPGCKNPAAPVFGMVCAKHKDLPKAKIREYRDARKAKAEAKTKR
jgi:hypothetical protein